MEKSMLSKKSVGASLFLALVFTLSLFVFGCSSSTTASAASGNLTFDGVWTGASTVVSGAKVTLTLVPDGGELRYGPPRNCLVPFEASVQSAEQKANHSMECGIKLSNGGSFCESIEDGKLLLKLGDDGQSMTYEAKSTDGASRDKGTLRRTGK